MRLRSRILLGIVATFVVGGLLAWRYQSELLGIGVEWYLTRIAASEEGSGQQTKRREIVDDIHRRLLMPPAADGMVAELFDLATLLASRTATGEVSLSWAAYLYTSYSRDLVQERPTGVPRRTREELLATLEQQLRFYAIRKRPDVPGVRVGDLVGGGDDTISLEEIEAAEREGRELDLQ